MNKSPRRRLFIRPQSGFSLVEMIGVLAIIAILAVVIVPKVFSTIASSRITNAVGSVSSMKNAIAEYAGKNGSIPLTSAGGGANARIDDLLVAAGMLEGRFAVKIGTPATPPTVAPATYNRTTNTWAGGEPQAAQTRIIALNSGAAPAATGTGVNYRLDGQTNLPAASTVVSAVIMQVTLNEARELSIRLDGDGMSQAAGSVAPDTAGKVTYNGGGTGNRNVFIYLAHQ